MASQRPPNALFWEFLQSLDPNRAHGPGVDRTPGPGPMPDFLPSGFPFHHGFGGPGRHGPPGPWDHWEQWFRGPDASYQDWTEPAAGNEAREPNVAPAEPSTTGEKDGSPDTMDVPDPAEVTPEDSDGDYQPFGRGRGRGHGRGHCHRGGPGRGGRGGFRHGHRAWHPHPPGHDHGPHGPRGHHRHGSRAPFDFAGLMRMFTEQFGAPVSGTADTGSGESAFQPPVDIFNTDRAYVVHVALPGAKKEDVGVSWDPDAGTLRVAGVVHRPGDEAFLQTLTKGERRVGEFERAIALPPPGDAKTAATKDEIDGFGITAKMEDGVLVVTVPKVEKEWTEVHKIDIE